MLKLLEQGTNKNNLNDLSNMTIGTCETGNTNLICRCIRDKQAMSITCNLRDIMREWTFQRCRNSENVIF